MFFFRFSLKTADVFEFFDGLGAREIEWLNDSSCCVVFVDEFAAARALLERSVAVAASTCVWRLAKRDNLSLILRAATTLDRRDPNAATQGPRLFLQFRSLHLIH